MSDNSVNIGINLRRILAQKGWKMIELIKRTEYTRNQIYRWMLPVHHSAHSGISAKQVATLAEVLGVSTDEIILGRTPPPPELTDLESTLQRTLLRVKESPAEWNTKIPREVINFLLTPEGQAISEILLDPPVIQFLTTYAKGKEKSQQ